MRRQAGGTFTDRPGVGTDQAHEATADDAQVASPVPTGGDLGVTRLRDAAVSVTAPLRVSVLDVLRPAVNEAVVVAAFLEARPGPAPLFPATLTMGTAVSPGGPAYAT